MRLNKLSCIAVMVAAIGLSNVALAANKATNKCPKGQFFAQKENKCVIDHGCKQHSHWSPKKKMCVA